MAMTTTEIAAEFETTPRTLRKFLRADAKSKGAPTPGKGSRYSIEKRELRSLRKRFNDWHAALEAKRAEGDSTDDAPEAPDAD